MPQFTAYVTPLVTRRNRRIVRLNINNAVAGEIKLGVLILPMRIWFNYVCLGSPSHTLGT